MIFSVDRIKDVVDFLEKHNWPIGPLDASYPLYRKSLTGVWHISKLNIHGKLRQCAKDKNRGSLQETEARFYDVNICTHCAGPLVTPQVVGIINGSVPLMKAVTLLSTNDFVVGTTPVGSREEDARSLLKALSNITSILEAPAEEMRKKLRTAALLWETQRNSTEHQDFLIRLGSLSRISREHGFGSVSHAPPTSLHAEDVPNSFYAEIWRRWGDKTFKGVPFEEISQHLSILIQAKSWKTHNDAMSLQYLPEVPTYDASDFANLPEWMEAELTNHWLTTVPKWLSEFQESLTREIVQVKSHTVAVFVADWPALSGSVAREFARVESPDTADSQRGRPAVLFVPHLLLGYLPPSSEHSRGYEDRRWWSLEGLKDTDTTQVWELFLTLVRDRLTDRYITQEDVLTSLATARAV